MAADVNQAPYSTLISRARANFHDPVASASFESSKILEFLLDALGDINTEYTTGHTIEDGAISPESSFDAYGTLATTMVFGASVLMARAMAVSANNDNIDIRKSGTSLSVGNQVRAWIQIAEDMQDKFDHAKQRLIYRSTTGERVTLNALTEPDMSTTSTVEGTSQ